jgi:hypothetical protein
MDYPPFFAQAQQPFFGMTMNPPSTYNGEDKIGHNVSFSAALRRVAMIASLGSSSILQK